MKNEILKSEFEVTVIINVDKQPGFKRATSLRKRRKTK
jgi:hypothetical protein